jgi:O-antigen ligase
MMPIQKIRSTALIYAAALFPALCLSFGKGYNLAAIVLLAAALPCLVGLPKRLLSHDAKLVITAFGLYFLSYVISMLINKGNPSFIDQPSRAILALPIFLALLRYPPPFKLLTCGLLAGSFIAGGIAFYYLYAYPETRAFDGGVINRWLNGYMQIQSGNMAATLSMLSLSVSIYFMRKSRFTFALLALIATGMGLSASFLSGSRGGWIFLPLAIIYLCYVNRDLLTKKITCLTLVGILITLTVVWDTGTVHQRVTEAVNNIQTYQQNKDKFTSLGIRLELWKSAIYSFTESPLVGLGEEGRLQSRIQHGEDGLIDLKISKLTWHSHNQFLEQLSVMGMMGLFTLIGFFAVPLVIFERIRHTSKETTSALCQCGSVSVIMMIGYCLTQAYFKHTSGIIFYSVITAILLATCLASTSEKELQ